MEGDSASKRVVCLYRVSTKQQLEDGDIPMQRNACQSFIAKQPGWELAKEYSERGVSGYHLSADQRDVLKHLKEDAQANAFDVLLVFMFDRLGRREDETPFIVEWFAERGVEVWSVCEGRQRFDNRVDRLLNYIRFWQSGGESEKTSARVAEKHRQMVLEGRFRGGSPPYGYRLVPSGVLSGKGRLLSVLEPEEREAAVVRDIFMLATDYGYGGLRIAQWLNEKGIPTKKGLYWTAQGVLTLLKNPIYKGQYVSGRRKRLRGAKQRMPADQWIHSQEKQQYLAIVSEDVWNRAEAIRLSRIKGPRSAPMQTRSPLLLAGILRCGECGRMLTSRQSIKTWRTKDGAEKRAIKQQYVCRKRGASKPCAGSHSFSPNRVEPVVLEAAAAFLAALPSIDLSETLAQRAKEYAAKESKLRDDARRRLETAGREVAALQMEIARSLTGNSRFTLEQLSSALSLWEQDREEWRKIADTPDVESIPATDVPDTPDWQAEFDAAPHEVKKMLLSALIESAVVSRDAIHIHFGACFDYPES